MGFSAVLIREEEHDIRILNTSGRPPVSLTWTVRLFGTEREFAHHHEGGWWVRPSNWVANTFVASIGLAAATT